MTTYRFIVEVDVVHGHGLEVDPAGVALAVKDELAQGETSTVLYARPSDFAGDVTPGEESVYYVEGVRFLDEDEPATVAGSSRRDPS